MSLSDLVARLAQWMAWFGLGSVLVSVPLALWRGDGRVLLFSAVLVMVPHPRTGERVRRLRALELRTRAFETAHHAAPAGYPPVTRRPQLRRTGVRW